MGLVADIHYRADAGRVGLCDGVWHVKTRFVILTVLIIAAAILSCGATRTPVQRLSPRINAAFLLGTNDSIMELIRTVAETLCINDKATDSTPKAFLKAAAQCADSFRDDQAMYSSEDGGWLAYQDAARMEIRRMCGEVDGKYELCQYFK